MLEELKKRNKTRLIGSAYRSRFHREPNVDEVNFWISFLEEGNNISKMISEMANRYQNSEGVSTQIVPEKYSIIEAVSRVSSRDPKTFFRDFKGLIKNSHESLFEVKNTGREKRPTKKFSGRIVQLVEALSYGDAVSDQVIAIDGMLRNLGFETLIQAKWFEDKENIREKRFELNTEAISEKDIIILHYCGYCEYTVPAALGCNCTRIICYHNITPEYFFEILSPAYEYCKKGRVQLNEMLPKFHYHWGDSFYNLEELSGMMVPNMGTAVLPISVPRPKSVDGFGSCRENDLEKLSC